MVLNEDSQTVTLHHNFLDDCVINVRTEVDRLLKVGLSGCPSAVGGSAGQHWVGCEAGSYGAYVALVTLNALLTNHFLNAALLLDCSQFVLKSFEVHQTMSFQELVRDLSEVVEAKFQWLFWEGPKPSNEVFQSKIVVVLPREVPQLVNDVIVVAIKGCQDICNHVLRIH